MTRPTNWFARCHAATSPRVTAEEPWPLVEQSSSVSRQLIGIRVNGRRNGLGLVLIRLGGQEYVKSSQIG